jgi:hypothetical protein
MDRLRSAFVGFFCTALTAVSATAHAQTYNLDITMVGGFPAPTTFVGKFTFNKNGTGLCSAGLCAPGVTPDFKNVFVTDPTGAYFGTQTKGFTYMDESGNTLTFVDAFGPNGLNGSYQYFLSFNLDSSLGGPHKNIGISDMTFTESFNITGIYSCGPNQVTPGLITCTTATLTKGHVPPKSGLSDPQQAKGVPEPGTFTLLALALAGLGAVTMRRGSCSTRGAT